MANTPENNPPQNGSGLLGRLVQKVNTISADIKKNFHPCEICGASITLDVNRCPSCDEAYQDLTDPARTPVTQDEIINLINRFARNLTTMADGPLKENVVSNLERLKEKLKVSEAQDKEKQAEQQKAEAAASEVLHSTTGEIFGYTTVEHKDIVTASVTETLSPNNGTADTKSAFRQALKAADLDVIRLGANAIVNLHVSCAGLESMTIAPRILYTITGDAVVVQKKP